MSKVSVILMHQLDINRPYLDLCIKSLIASRDIEFDVFLMSGGISEPPTDLPKHFHVNWDQSLVTATQKINKGIQLADAMNEGYSDLLILSDDIILNRYAIADMYQGMGGRLMIMNPMSNSDCTSMYEANIYLEYGQRLIPDMKIEDFFDGFEQYIIERMPRRDKCLVPFQTLSFFCTLIPRQVWAKVGALDPELEYRHNDQDYCMRALQIGIPSVVNFGAFVFHFGSRTINVLGTNERKDKCTAHFKKKWHLT